MWELVSIGASPPTEGGHTFRTRRAGGRRDRASGRAAVCRRVFAARPPRSGFPHGLAPLRPRTPPGPRPATLRRGLKLRE